MTEQYNDQVAAIVIYQMGQTPLPWKVKWRGRYLTFKQVDLCHPVWEGRTQHYIYSVSDGNNFYRIDYNTRSQAWTLMEVSDGLPS